MIAAPANGSPISDGIAGVDVTLKAVLPVGVSVIGDIGAIDAGGADAVGPSATAQAPAEPQAAPKLPTGILETGVLPSIVITDVNRSANTPRPELPLNPAHDNPSLATLNSGLRLDHPAEILPLPMPIPPPTSTSTLAFTSPIAAPTPLPMPLPNLATEQEQPAIAGASTNDTEGDPVDNDTEPNTSQTSAGPKKSTKMKPTASKTPRYAEI